jgi:outer membrane receptor protein involved in Fe transport
MADALERLPGVSMVDDQGSRIQPTLNLRGFTLSPVVGIPQGVSVFLDGVRINEPDAQELNFDLIPIDAVSDAELVRGSATLFGKNSLAGALLLSTKRGEATPAASASLQTGAFGFRGATVTASGTGSSGILNGIDAYVMGNASNEVGWRDDTGASTRMLFGNFGRRRGNSDIALSAMYAHDRALLAGSLPESWLDANPRANFTGGDFFEPDLLHIALRGQSMLARGTLRGNAFFRRNNIEQYNVNIDAPSTRALIRNRSTGGAVEWSLPARLARHDAAITLGAEYSRNDVNYHTFADRTSDAHELPADCDQTSGLCEDARVPEDDAALYAQADLQMSPKLSLIAAARADYVRVPFRDLLEPQNDGTSTFRQVSPRVGLTYRINPKTSGYVSSSTGFRAPAALELACADENAPCSLPSALGDDPPLAPVTVRTFEAGLDHTIARDARLGVSLYQTDVHNEIVFVASDLTAGFFQNIPRTRRQGAEVTGEAPLPAGFRISASYDYLNATYESTVALASEISGNVAHPGDRFPLSPAHQARLSLENAHTFRSALLDAQISTRAVSGQFLRSDDANQERPLSPYAVTDARLGWHASRYRIDAHISNLFDRSYNSFGVFGENPVGAIAGPRPTEPVTERFLTPGYPRTVTLSITLQV